MAHQHATHAHHDAHVSAAISSGTVRAAVAVTFSYHRVGIFAAGLNAVSLVGIALVIGWEAVVRIGHSEPASGGLMMAVAAAAIVVNLVVAVSASK